MGTGYRGLEVRVWARDRERLTQIPIPASLNLQGFVTVRLAEFIGDMELSLAATNLGQLHHETILVEAHSCCCLPLGISGARIDAPPQHPERPSVSTLPPPYSYPIL